MTPSMRGYFAAALLGLGLVGCGTDPVKITGGGSLPADTGRAYFGFTANTCSTDNIRGQMAYVDQGEGLLAHAEIRSAFNCANRTCVHCDAGEIQVNMGYRSLMRHDPGEGTAIACVSGTDHLTMKFLDGPYAGYVSSGDVQGEVRFHECPPADE